MKLWRLRNPASLVTPWMLTADGCHPFSDLSDDSLASIQLDSACLVIPRHYLFYIYIDLAAVPHAQRSLLIQQRMRQASPFTNPASWIVQEQDSAQIWFWDAEIINWRRQQFPDMPVSVVPESLLCEPFVQGFRLQQCLNGWELQYWAVSRLRHTRWLPDRPNSRAQTDFARTCGFGSDQQHWVEVGIQLLPRPWNEKPFWSKETLISEPVATRLLAGLLLAWVTLELGMNLGTWIKGSYLSSAVAAQSSAMMDVVNQRDGALRQKEFNQAISDLTKTPTPLFLAAQVHQCLAGLEFVILDWQYQRGQLTIILQKEGLDTRALIESCSANPSFANVRVEPGITPEQTRVLFSLPVATSEVGSDA